MRKKILIGSTIAILVTLSTQTVIASSMRCGGHLITEGARQGPGKYEVLKKCGEPIYRQGDTWVYEKAGKRYVVRFDALGRVRAIGEP